MNTSTTQPPAPQLALIALSEKADGGTWDFQEEMTEFYNDADGNSCGGHPTGNYYIWDKDGPNEDDAWIHPHHKENAEFICALVNWFRANYSTQSRPEAELSEEVHKWHWHAESVSEWGRQNLARAEAAEAKHATLLTGLEALADRLYDGFLPYPNHAELREISNKLRTLASAGLEGKKGD